jgi:sugar phosphate isomerase/epimerase
MLVFSSASLERYGLHRIFRFAKTAGYDGIDIEVSKSCDTQDATYLKEISTEMGLPIVSIVTPKKIGGQDKIIKFIKLAQDVGASNVIINPPNLFDFGYTQWLKNDLPGIRKRENIHIALLNSTGGRMFGFLPENALNSLNDLKKFKEVCIDTSNVYDVKEDLIRMYEKLKTEIIHIFLSNVKNGKDHALPMEGSLPLESLLTKLKKDNFKGALSIRVNGKELGEGDETKVINHLVKIKEFVSQYYQ